MARLPRMIHAWALVCLMLGMLSCTTSAHAAESIAANYAGSSLEYRPGAPIVCRGWSGGTDAAGHFYTACPGPAVPYIYEFDENGKYLRYAQLPAAYLFDNTYRMRDVAATPDGRTLYVNVGPIVDDLGGDPTRPGGAYAGAILKFVRQLDGSWAHDAAWRSGPYLLGGRYWAPRFMDVDDAGRIYVGVNAFVYELSPANGAVVSAFGGVSTAYPGGPWAEGIDVALGIAVAPDGNSLFVVEQRHHLLQRWVRVPNVGWKRDTTWGPNRNGLIGEPSVVNAAYCQRTDRLQSPYDIGDDIAGDIYLADTSCHRILRYDLNGNFVQTVWTNGLNDELVHGIAVNSQGSVMIPETERMLLRKDPAKKVCVDTVAPTITGTGIGTTSSTRALTITVTGTDDCSGVTAVRVSGSIIGAPTWVDGASTTVQLAGWNGAKNLTIEARDATGKVATTTAALTLALPQPTLIARTSVGLRSKGCRVGNPMKRVAKASTFRLVGRCARISGNVQQVKVSKFVVKIGKRRVVTRTYRAQLMLSTAAAQAIYANAVGPVTIWVVTDRATRVKRAPTKGRTAVVVGTLIATRARTAVTAIPVDALA